MYPARLFISDFSMVADLVLRGTETIITRDKFATGFQKIDYHVHIHIVC
jgi:hypothetical protein